MNVKQTSKNNQNILWGQPDMFDVFEPITDGENNILFVPNKNVLRLHHYIKFIEQKTMKFFIKLNLKI